MVDNRARSYISIPTGTIKSDLRFHVQAIRIIFQFLLVRLKVLKPYGFDAHQHISIPTGTIKRIE